MEYTKIGDLTPLTNEIIKLIKKYFKLEENPSIGLCLTLPPDYDRCHWITNVSRENGIKLFRDTAIKMQSQIN